VLAAHVFVTAAQLVMTKRSVGSGRERGGGRRRRAAYAAGVNAAMALVFLAASILRKSAFSFAFSSRTLTSARRWTILATIPASIAIVRVQTETQAATSAAGFAALNNAAKAFSVLVAFAVGEKAPTSASLAGLVATFAGGLWYVRVSARLKASPEASRPGKTKRS
jgi:hypothetical protein